MLLRPWAFTRDMRSLRDTVERFAKGAPPWPHLAFKREASSLAADVSETPDAYVLIAEIPGVDPGDLEITAVSNAVTIKGERKDESGGKGSYLRRERPTGAFERTFVFPLAIEPAALEATGANGILTITMPKSEKNRPTRVPVRIADREPMPPEEMTT